MNSRSYLTLCLTGDVMIGRGVDQLFDPHCLPPLHEPFVTDARAYVALAENKNGPIPRPTNHAFVWGDALQDIAGEHPDFRVVNLETSLTTSDHFCPEKSIHYRAHPAQAGILRRGVIDCCVLANNHVADWGREGLEETLTTLRAGGFATVGAGLTQAEAAAPVLLQRRGISLQVLAMGSVTSGIPLSWQASQDRSGIQVLEGSTVPRICDHLRKVREKATPLLVSIHWGGNWGYGLDPAQISLAHALIDQGDASLVHFHSSHHPKAIEVYQGKLILYGCGDLINDYEGIGGHEDFHPDLGMIYCARIDAVTGHLVALRTRVYIRRCLRLAKATLEETKKYCAVFNAHAATQGWPLRDQGSNACILEGEGGTRGSGYFF